MNKISLIDLGADPEVFLRDKKSGNFISAIGLIPGDKYSPFPVSDNGHAIQVDNVTAEITVPPSNKPEVLMRDIKFALSKVKEYIPKHLEIVIQGSAVFTAEQLRHPAANHFGCDPDFNAYTGQENPKPNSKTLNRSAGAHLHCLLKNLDPKRFPEFIRTLDLFLGVPSVILDDDKQRRKLYGKAGAFRFTNYGGKSGVEYRVLSNFWIKNQSSVNWVYSNVDAAINFMNSDKSISKEDSEDIVRIINTGDMNSAVKMCKKYKVNFII